jgi:tRNA(Ile)-lysidine synthetase-like protein
LKDNNVKYFIDKTNKQNIHTRNRYRKFVNIFLKKENKNIHKKYLKFSNELENYDNFINKYIKDKKLIKNNKVDLNILLKEDNLIQRKVIELLIKEIQKDDLLDVSDNVTYEVLKMITSKKSNNQINLNNGYIARKDYNILSIIKEKSNEEYEVIFDNYFENDEWIIEKKDSDKKSNFVLRLDSNDIKLPLIIRNKKDSDKIYVKNLGTKKVKDIFINEKISIDKRKTYPILVDSNNTVLWLPGLKKSKFDKEKNEKYDIILTSERKR